jgi:Fe(3+) dicitrate transport protein
MVSGRYAGLTRTTPGQNEVTVPGSNENFSDVNAIEAYTILDLSANYHFNEMWTVYTTVNNLTNNRRIVANLPQGYRPAMPFALNLGVKINL